MTRTPVTSRSLASIGYDPDTRTLDVEFRNGRVYRYEGISAARHAALLDAPSIGRHFSQHIRTTAHGTRLEESR